MLVPLLCPLTVAENWLRLRAGEPVLQDGFIDHYLTGVVYPADQQLAVRLLAGAVVLTSWLLAYRRLRTVRHPMLPGTGGGSAHAA